MCESEIQGRSAGKIVLFLPAAVLGEAQGGL